ncbi:MAG: putative Na+/H+ antiporter [Alphaproteobacteria bacterium]|nr:putative Na+/H+ antiporter [Alphaproteobacteria bacterium]
MEGIWSRLVHRAAAVPFNLAATAIFILAVIHTFLSSRFLAIAHKWEHQHEERKAARQVPKNSVSHGAELFHFLGEVEVIFGLWVVVLGIAVVAFFDWPTFVGYVSHRVNFTEAMFVVVIMALASTRPILKISEAFMDQVARLLGGSVKAWWFTVLTLGPLLGSFITEPAAMTITALLLANKFYELEPGEAFKYATIGLLFVNVSIGGTLTHFAAPPVLMVASPWEWGTAHMLSNFGWKAILGIVLSNALYFVLFRSQFNQIEERFALRRLKEEVRKRFLPRDLMEADFDAMDATIDKELQFEQRIGAQVDEAAEKYRTRLAPKYFEEVMTQGIDRELAQRAFDERFEEIKLAKIREAIPLVLPPAQRAPFVDPDWDTREDPVPLWVTIIHVIFMAWTIFNAHDPELFIAAMLFFLGFAVVSSPYQNRIDLKPPLLVGFFLAGLVVHGGLQGWWIEPVLGSLTEVPLMASATILTAFNDNAAITYLSTLVPNLSDELKYAVVSGAVAGGGLTVIANAPNPAGQSLLKRFFENGVSPPRLFLAALAPTLIAWFSYLLL